MSEHRQRGNPRRWLPWAAAGTAPAASGPVSSGQVTSVANQVVPSVVTIAARGLEGAGTGSGEVIKSDGYILTNNHVISIAAASGGSVHVMFADSIVGQPATSNQQLQELSLTKKAGDSVAIEYERDGATAKTTVTLGAHP